MCVRICQKKIFAKTTKYALCSSILFVYGLFLFICRFPEDIMIITRHTRSTQWFENRISLFFSYPNWAFGKRSSFPSKMASTSMSVRSPASFPFPTAAGARGRVGTAQPVGPKLLSSPLPPVATPAVPRRLLFPVAAGIWDFLSGGGAGGAAAASLAGRRGMQLFRQVWEDKGIFLSRSFPTYFL